MGMLAQATDYTDKDFDSLRLRLQALVRSVFPTWTDFNVGNFGNLLIELYANGAAPHGAPAHPDPFAYPPAPAADAAFPADRPFPGPASFSAERSLPGEHPLPAERPRPGEPPFPPQPDAGGW